YKTASGASVVNYDQSVFRQGKFIGLLRAVIRLETLHSFISTHQGGDTYFFLLDQEGRLLSYPDTHYLGQSLLTLFQDNNLSLKETSFGMLMDKLGWGEEGSGEYLLFPLDSPHKAEKSIAAFSPIYFGAHVWSLVAVEDYDSFAGPVNKNARDNIIFGGIIVLILLSSAVFLYRDQKRKNEELKAAQSLLIQTAKMEVIGKLAAGVAHEVKNPLAVIQMSVDYLKQNVKSQDEDVIASLEDAENAVSRADTIIKGLLDFSASSDLDIKMQDIHALIDRSLTLVKYILEKNHVRVIKSFGEDIPMVGIDKNKIEQVFVNLLMNAVQAMPAGGELEIRTFRTGSSDERQMIIVQIEDNGSGIPESVLKDLYVPFVTTKRDVGGTGLGLSIVRNIMELHGGKIAVENNEDGQGVCARLWFNL
ncbi:MAG: ATP-binding protein, partial [Candidatus Omnitrophota bacterium]